MTARSKQYILAIDPGNTESAFCLVNASDLRPLAFAKTENMCGKEDVLIPEMMKALAENGCGENTQVVIENMESFGMPVGRSILDTCIWIGELKRWFTMAGLDVAYVFRHEEKMTICHSARANDATIKQALIDRFAPNTSNYGKGSKKQKGFFYGFSADVWSSFAIATTYHDKYLGKIEGDQK